LWTKKMRNNGKVEWSRVEWSKVQLFFMLIIGELSQEQENWRLSMGDSSYRLHVDLGKKNEIQHHS
jgi:hypothetical protein